jgi:hypothetical protein
MTTEHSETRINNHALSGIRIHDLSVQVIKDFASDRAATGTGAERLLKQNLILKVPIPSPLTSSTLPNLFGYYSAIAPTYYVLFCVIVLNFLRQTVIDAALTLDDLNALSFGRQEITVQVAFFEKRIPEYMLTLQF